MTDKRDEIQELAWSIYCNNLSEDHGYYAREADEEGLAAIFRAGVAAGRAANQVDLGPFIGDGDVFIINEDEYKARFIEEDMIGGYDREGIRLVLVKEKK